MRIFSDRYPNTFTLLTASFFIVTKEQIEKWKKEHGIVFLLEAEGGKLAYIEDTLHNFNIVKQAYAALDK